LQLRIASDAAVTFAEAFKALGHPVRLQIFDLISQGLGETCSCDIEQHFDLTQPTISHHLKVLRDAGLIASESRGVWVHHRLNQTIIDSIRSLLSSMHP
jgi:DNA-binding transcriptional ArsR family regulator